MSGQASLFDFPGYPDGPGYTNQTTSREAAAKVAPKAGTQAARCLAFITERGQRGATPDECAEALDILVVSARPRCTQLKIAGLVVEAGERANENGNNAIVYRAAPPGGAPKLSGKGRGLREREAVCAWLRKRAQAGWSADLVRAAEMIEAGNHLERTE